MHKKNLFDKRNLKFIFIWVISFLLSGLLKLIGYLNPNILITYNFLLLLVFGPAILVTIILVFNKFLNSYLPQK